MSFSDPSQFPGFIARERKYSEVLPSSVLARERSPPPTQEISYYTKVFETEEPQTIAYVGSFPGERIERTPLISSPPMSPNGLAQDANKGTFAQLENRTVQISRAKRGCLFSVTLAMALITAATLCGYFTMMGDVDIRLLSIETASIDSDEFGLIDLQFILSIDNPNVQDVEIHSIEMDLTFVNETGFFAYPMQVLQIGPIHNTTELEVDGMMEQSFSMNARFDIKNPTTRNLVIDALRFGAFDAKMTGIARFNTAKIFTIASDIDTSVYIDHPLLSPKPRSKKPNFY